MRIKVLYCGECPLFLNENIDGSGQCKITQELTHCGDSCELEFLNKQLLAEQAKKKKLVEALEKISNGDRMTYCRSREALLFGCANKDALNINCHSCDYFIAQQALNEVNSNERTRTTKA